MSKNVHFSSNQLAYIEWMAHGKLFREPSTQKEFAEKLGVSEKTLCRWKKGQNGFTKDDFWNAVTLRSRELVREAIPNIFAASIAQAEDGNHQHAKMILEIVGEYQEKRELSGDIRINVVYESIDTDSS